MFADGGDFLAGEFAGLFENGVGDTELADVVEKAGAAKTRQILVGKSEGAANVHGGIGDTVGMLIGKRRFRVDDFRGNADAVDRLLVRGEAAVLGFHGQHFGVQIFLFQVIPECAIATE